MEPDGHGRHDIYNPRWVFLKVLKVFARAIASTEVHTPCREPTQEAAAPVRGLSWFSVNIHNMLFVYSAVSATECPLFTGHTFSVSIISVLM